MDQKLTPHLLEQYLNELIHNTRIAHEHYEIWWIYKKDRPKYVETMNDYLGFFQASIQAHFIAMLMSLSKLYENRDDTINIARFINLIDASKLIDNTILAKVRRSLSRKRSVTKKIFILRNNYFAHRSKKLSYDKILKETSIKYKNFKELINLSYRVLKKIAYSYNKGDVSSYCFSKKDTHKLLKALCRERHTRVLKRK